MSEQPERARATPAAVPAWPLAARLAEGLVGVADGTVCAVLLYGSHLLGTNPDEHSAVDLVLIVDDYRSFHRALARAGELHRPVSLMTVLARALPPNVMAYAPDDGRAGTAKNLVLSRDDFARALGPEPRDHFVLGRLVQRVGVVWTASNADASWVGERIADGRARVLDWIAPYLSGPFDAEALGRRVLEVCYQGEFRPESTARAGRVFEAQAQHFRASYGPLLEAAAEAGTLVRRGDAYELAVPVDASVERRWRRHFRRSKARSTLRWLKHTITFVNWLPYIVRKVERHTGRRIELTTLERRMPLVFLWPRVLHVLLTRPRREIEN